MFTLTTSSTHASALSGRRRTFTVQIGALAASALLAATLSVALLPLQDHAVPQLDGHSTTADSSTGHLSPTSDGVAVRAFVVTKGQKG